ncbi:hypothetical protein, partial [Streptomyces niveiscabiei]|uniref:hypothetical protein n=1 Tax=Streptomyces niveiscabiei TaxID=164115 RepID=UPI0038F768A0
WGDVLLSVQRFRDELGEGNVIYMGPFDDVLDFLKQQPFIHEVKHVKTDAFFSVIRHVFEGGTLEPNWQQKFNPDNTIPNELIVPTFLTNKINL